METEIRYYQRAAIDRVKDKGLVKIMLPCGTGKTLAARHILLDQHSCVILVPLRTLMEQTYEYFMKYGIETTRVGTGYNKDVPQDSKYYVCVYDSAQYLPKIEYDAIIVDEAHHLEDKYDPEDSTIECKGVKLKCKKCVMMSATLLEGNIDYELSLRTAINQEYLSDFEVHIPIYKTPPTVQKLVKFIKDNPQYSKILAFFNDLAGARDFHMECLRQGISSMYFSGKSEMSERLSYIDMLKSGALHILCTVRTIGEGINIQDANTCLFIQNRGSVVSVTQCIGRVLRRAEGKTAYVILPPVTGDIDSAKNITKFIRIIDRVDDRTVEELKRTGAGGGGRCKMVMVDPDSEHLKTNVYDNMGKLLNSDFAKMSDDLSEYVQLLGHLPPRDHPKFGAWMKYIRDKHKRKTLSEEEKEVMDRIPGWAWKLRKSPDELFDELKEFVTEHGRFPSHGEPCYAWARSQIGFIISQSIKEKLESLPGWTEFCSTTDRSTRWKNAYAKIKKFVEENIRYPNTRNDEEKEMYQWLNHKRRSRPRLAEWKVKLLEDLPDWSWVADISSRPKRAREDDVAVKSKVVRIETQ